MYTAEISRTHPTVILFLLDQSDSMKDDQGGIKELRMKKEQAAADVINKTLYNFVMRCSSGPDIKNYFDIGMIGYGREADWVGPIFEGALKGRDIVTIEDVSNNPAKIEEREKLVSDNAGGVIKKKTKFPTWISPFHNWNTPMCKTFEYAYGVLEGWIANHRECYPPTVINITDGQSTDGDPTDAARRLTSLATDDGNVLLYNCHLSETNAPSILFPDQAANLPDQFATLLFNISSVFPETARQNAVQEGYTFTPKTRGFVFNADFASLVTFMDIGTRTNKPKDS